MRKFTCSLIGTLIVTCCTFTAFNTAKGAASSTSADEKAVREVDRQFSHAIETHNMDELMKLLSPNIASLTHKADMPKVQGTESVRNLTQAFFRGTPNAKITATPVTIVVSKSGDMAYDLGDYVMTYDSPDGRKTDKGRYLFVLQKINGSWLIAVHSGVAGIWDDPNNKAAIVP